LAVQFIDCYHECRSSTFEEERLISFLRDRCNLQRLEHAAFLDDGHQLLHKLHHEVVLEKAIQLQQSESIGEYKAILIENIFIGQDISVEVQVGQLSTSLFNFRFHICL
jgi:hypothetical protein